MDELNINGKAIYATKGAAREYGRIGCNFYKGCPHECSYCYLKRGAPSKNLGGNVAEMKKCFKDEEDALAKFKQDVERYNDVLRETGVFFSFTTDPLIPETRTLTVRALQVLMEHDIPAQVLTKDTSWIFDEYTETFFFGILPSSGKDIRIGFTLTGHDEMEPKASKNTQRIAVMQMLKEYHPNVKTWASIEPVIDWKHADIAVRLSLDCCDHYKIGLRSGVKKDYYDLAESAGWLEGLPRLITAAGKTVYLKESVRRLMRRCFTEEHYNEILSYTVDMDGREIRQCNNGK